MALENRDNYRGDCSFCGGKNTYTATKEGGQLRWNCYNFNCTIRGDIQQGLTLSDISRLRKEATDEPRPFVQPEYWADWQQHPACVKYLKDNNCMDAVEGRRVQVLFDPKVSRIVFLNRDGKDVVDAIGRRLGRGSGPKWLRYGRSDLGHVVPVRAHGARCVLVEDVASACSVSRVVDSMALLGTSVSDHHLVQLRSIGYSSIVVALDPDAAIKALAIHKRLSYHFKSVIIQQIPDDLKYFDIDQLERILNGTSADKTAAD